MSEAAIRDLEAKADGFHNERLKRALLRKLRILLQGVDDPRSVSLLTSSFGRELDEELNRQRRLVESLPSKVDSPSSQNGRTSIRSNGKAS